MSARVNANVVSVVLNRTVANVRHGAVRTVCFGMEKPGGGAASAAPRGRDSGRDDDIAASARPVEARCNAAMARRPRVNSPAAGPQARFARRAAPEPSPLLVPGLGGGVHRRTARGVRARACARQRQPGRGRVFAYWLRPYPVSRDLHPELAGQSGEFDRPRVHERAPRG